MSVNLPVSLTAELGTERDARHLEREALVGKDGTIPQNTLNGSGQHGVQQPCRACASERDPAVTAGSAHLEGTQFSRKCKEC